MNAAPPPPRARRRPAPLVVLIAVALVPAIFLFGAWRYADGNVPPPTTTTTTTLPPPPTPELETPLLSFRRNPEPLAERVAVDEADAAYEALAAEFLARVPAGSCARLVVDDEVLAEVEPDLPLVPASNQKLLVAATALEVLGPGHRFRTELVGPAPVEGIVGGDVYLVGGGDPVLVTDLLPDPRRFPAFNTTRLEGLVDQLVELGVTRIEGDVVGDGSRYDDEPGFRAPSWGDDVIYGVGGPYDALLVNDGLIDQQNYGLNPSRAAAAVFVDLLAARGITVAGAAANAAAPDDPALTTIAAIRSRPLDDVMVELLHTSDNNTAEMLVKEIGYVAAGEGSRTAGLRIVRETLAAWHVSLEGIEIEDGSGLSRANRLTCRLLTSLLADTPVADALRELLPVAGRDGTLATSFVDTVAEARLRAKTGTLTGVKALTGSLRAGDKELVDFALVLNGEGVDEEAVHVPLWNELVELIDAYPVEVVVDVERFAPVAPLTAVA